MSNSTHSSSGARAAADPITAASSPYYVANDKRGQTLQCSDDGRHKQTHSSHLQNMSDGSGSRVVMIDTHIERYSALAL